MFGSAEDDEVWRKHGEREGWTLPFVAPWPLRLPVIRTVRAAWFSYKVDRWARGWGAIGIGMGNVQPYDGWVLYAIATGKA